MASENSQTHRDLAAMRQDYAQSSLDEHDVDPDPIRQLIRWIDQASEAEVPEPNAITLATCENGRPSARMMLVKEVDEGGLVFFTNYESRKGKELSADPNAAVVFWWPQLQRQVRVEGTVARTSAEVSREYFNKRPADARLGAVVSPQSQVVTDRHELEKRLAELTRQYPDGNVPCPPHWGGYRLRPSMMEFWQGRTGRLHDRIAYIRAGSGWKIQRLAP